MMEAFTRVMAPIIARAALAPRTNAYWLAGRDWAQTHADALDRLRTSESSLKALTAEPAKTVR